MRTLRHHFSAAITLSLLLTTLATPGRTQTLGDPPNTHSRVGTNLTAIEYFNAPWVFTDVMKMCAPWIPQEPNSNTWNTGKPLTLDPQGWPRLSATESAGTLIFVGIAGRYPAGDYVCLYEGSGEIQFGGDARIKSQTKGRIVVQVNPSNGGIYLKVRKSAPHDHLRKIRLIMPGFEPSYQKQVFHPRFLQRLAKYRSLRFMDWQRTNNSKLKTWASRTAADSYSQALDNGVALEFMVDLCNTLSADPWICIPHQADDDFVRRAASLVAQRLKPGLRPYLEYSNEVWNGSFAQHRYATDEGIRLSLTQDRSVAAAFFYGTRSRQIFKIWETAFAARRKPVKVLATQFVNDWITRKMLDFKSVYKEADVLAGAPYLFPHGSITLGNAKDALTAAEKYLDTVITPMIKARVGLAKSYGLPLITYEGGQHLVAPRDPRLTGLFIAANRDPGMGALYEKFLRAWFRDGGGLFCHYSHCSDFTKWGSWGSLEYEDQPSSQAPKFQALQKILDESAAVMRFGAGCGGLKIGTRGRPVPGDRLTVLQDGGSAVVQRLFLLGRSRDLWAGRSLPMQLASLGAAGCFLRVSVNLPGIPGRRLAGGGAALDFDIPKGPTFLGSELHVQAYAFTSGPGLLTSAGLRLRVVSE